MTTFKAGYYIDEFNKQIEPLVGVNPLKLFFASNLFFTTTNLPEYLNIEDANPLLKVAWNIVTRGAPTRASLALAENILAEHLKDDFSGTNSRKSEIELTINNSFFQDLDGNLLLGLLTDFKSHNEGKIAVDYGTKCLKIYRILFDLLSSAQIQLTILLLLLSEKNNNDGQFSIIGIRKTLQEVIISDLNSLFSHLNDLVSQEEDKLPLLNVRRETFEIKISFLKGEVSSFVILPFQPHSENYFNRVLTDRKINYLPIGKVIEEEIQRKYVQRFEYTTINQGQALLYFLQNVFRKSKFKAGQEAIINRAIQGQDVIGLLPTGGGKSLTYQICSLLHPGVTVVVDPINSLMKDQFDKLLDHGISKANFINSFNTKDEREKNLEELTEGKYLIIFVSPERFQIEHFRHSIASCSHNHVYFSFAVIDEAHCVSEWGHDFRHTYLKLAQNLKRFCVPKQNDSLTLFGLTATASFDVLADVQRELEMPESAIIRLPAEAIDRKELNFEILKITTDTPDSLEYWKRENMIGGMKYPLIKSVLEQLPIKIKRLEAIYGYLNPNPNFYRQNAGTYSNAGIIFCPTKSNKLKNGVLSLYDYLSKEAYLAIGTFFGGASDDSIKDERIESEADRSIQNQVSFITNKKNLMIATKAFGMGIDKPNIRFSIHYSFPNSVESFYQEAGRAGRDGNPSICTILYHPKDILTNYDFYRNAFKGIVREKEIIDELLEEVKYEDHFYVTVVKRLVQDKFPIVHQVSLWNDRYLNVFGPYNANPELRVNIGKIDLNHRDLKNYDNFRKNITQNDADNILNYLRRCLQKECGEADYLTWLKSSSTDGIKTLIESQKSDEYSLKIGFTNDTITKMTETITAAGYEGFEEVVIRAAYNFTSSEYDFIKNLEYQYSVFQRSRINAHPTPVNFQPDSATEEYLLRNYYKIRNSSDTQRAIYRMSIVGIIDDYIIDYVGGFIEVRFKAKSDAEYIDNLKTYLKRYLGNQSTENWIKKVKESNETSILQKVLYILIEFIEEEISDKRKRSINYMKDLCENGYLQGDRYFRENIIYYFTSKYATMSSLPKDTDGGRLENAEIVTKYLNYISQPPDGLGGEIDNAKHLQGACANLRITMTQENASINLLTAYCYFTLDANETDNFPSTLERPLVTQAIDLYRKGFSRLLEIEPWNNCKDLIRLFNHKILDINPVIRPLLSSLTAEVLMHRTTYRLTQFLNKVS